MSAIEFSRPVRVEPLPRDGLTQQIEANAAERAALAALNGLPDIARLSARFRIVKSGKGVRVEGEVSARVTQTCVVSLEPFEADIEEPVDVRFLPPGSLKPATETHGIDEDETDELIDGKIDLGALAAEFFTLALDPYPRKPGAAFESGAEPSAAMTPFSGLHKLSGRDEPD